MTPRFPKQPSRGLPTSRHAYLARRAVAQAVAAKLAGDAESAAQFAALAAREVDRHLAELRQAER